MKTTSSILSFCAILGLAMSLSDRASAQNTVSPVGIPLITSYAPAAASEGESVLANLTSDTTTFGGAVFGETATVTHILFRTSIGLPVSAPVTYVAPKLIRFTIPKMAITGATTLMKNTQLNSRVQPSFSVVPFASRPRGFTIINSAQWDVSSVKTGTTELLTGTPLRTGEARFFSRSLTANRPLPLSLTFQSSVSANMPATPLFTVPEQVMIPGTASGLTLVTRTELNLEPFTVTEILRMGATTANARWKVLQRRFNRTMEVTPEGGVILTQLGLIGHQPAPINLTIDEQSATFSQSFIRFSLKQGSRRSGEVITMYAPFDSFSANELGPWSLEDELPATVSPNVAPPPSADDLQPSPMMVRRVN